MFEGLRVLEWESVRIQGLMFKVVILSRVIDDSLVKQNLLLIFMFTI
jgi:hypothetical protein